MFYFTVIDRSAVGGVMITASHNPPKYNGMKIVRDGAVMVSGTEVEKLLKSKKPQIKTPRP